MGISCYNWETNLKQNSGVSAPLPLSMIAAGGLTMAVHHFTPTDSIISTPPQREEIARQLLPLLQQFEATYDHADLVMTPLGEAFRRIIFNAQYHAGQGGTP